MNNSNALAEIQSKYPNCNLLLPAATSVQINPFYKCSVMEVVADTAPSSGDIFSVGKVKTGEDGKGKAIYEEVFSPAKPLLMKLATAAGIQFHPEYTTVIRENTNTYVGKAYGAVRLPDGSYKTHMETKRICLDDEESKYRLEFMDKSIMGIHDWRASKAAAEMFKGEWKQEAEPNQYGKYDKYYVIADSDREKYIERSILVNMTLLSILAGLDRVPYIVRDDLTPEQVKAYRIADNKLAELSNWDDELLKKELFELQAVDYSLEVMGFTEIDLKEIFTEKEVPKEKKKKEEKTTLPMLRFGSNSVRITEDELVMLSNRYNEYVESSGTKVQTMVEQPLFYTKVVPVKSSVSSSGRGKKYDKARFYISPTPKAGFKPVDGFLDDNGILQDKIYLSAFEGSIFDTSAGAYLKADEQVADFATDMLSSIAGAKPASGLTQNLTRANVRKLCTNRGKGWKSHNIFALTATQWLILIEYASMNAQSVIGQGVSTFTDDGSTNMAVVTGATSGLGNGSGIDPNAGVDGKCSVSYRGEENLWGNIWTWLDAINIYNDKASGVYNAFVKPYGECKDDTTADGYKALDFNIATGEGYISGFGYDEDHPDLFLCAEHNGASNLPVGDYYWNNNDGFRVAILGGKWIDGAGCGAWCLTLYNASSIRYRTVGGRLLYVPQTKISA